MPTSDYFHIEIDARRRLVRLVRTATPLPLDADAIKRVYEELTPSLQGYAGYRALLDVRAVSSGRNDDAFEQLTRRAESGLSRIFSRTAILVRSAVGKLQVRRMTEGQRAVFQDEAEAIRFLVAE
jgi:hypothetical protein